MGTESNDVADKSFETLAAAKRVSDLERSQRLLRSQMPTLRTEFLDDHRKGVATPVIGQTTVYNKGEIVSVTTPAPPSIDATLAERGSRYGTFPGHASITQALKSVMRGTSNWAKLAPDQQEALEMIAHKVGRILNGDPNYHDSWHDIVGYTKLVADRLAGKVQ